MVMSEPTERAEMPGEAPRHLDPGDPVGSGSPSPSRPSGGGRSGRGPQPAPKRSTNSRLRAILAVGVLTLALGAGLFAIGSVAEGTPHPEVGPNLPVNTGAASALDIRAHNSPTVVQSPVEPAVLAVVNRVDTPRFSCALHLSADGAASWAEGRLPFPAGQEDPPRCFAPDAVFDTDGNLHVSFVTLIGTGNTPHALWATSSADGGRTFSPPVQVAGPLTFQARLAADPAVRDRLYLSWLQAAGTGNLLFPATGYPVMVSRSDDGGRSWQTPVRVSPPGRARVVAPSLAVGSEALFVSYLDLGDDALDYHGAHEGHGGDPYPGTWSLVLARSTDQGATWQEAVVDDAVVPTERFIVFLPPVPSLAVDRSNGHVYLGFQDGRRGDPDVWVWASPDGGVTFRSPVQVNDSRLGDGTSQYRPEVAVAPDGRLDVLYYDRREDSADIFNGTSLQSSSDGGRSFGPRVRVAEKPFDSRIGFGSLRGMADLGSRLALLSADDRALAVWTDTRSGTDVTNKQDIAQAIVTFPESSSTRALLRTSGLILTVLALFILVGGSVAARRGSRGH